MDIYSHIGDLESGREIMAECLTRLAGVCMKEGSVSEDIRSPVLFPIISTWMTGVSVRIRGIKMLCMLE